MKGTLIIKSPEGLAAISTDLNQKLIAIKVGPRCVLTGSRAAKAGRMLQIWTRHSIADQFELVFQISLRELILTFMQNIKPKGRS